jgi:hypothetical protein
MKKNMLANASLGKFSAYVQTSCKLDMYILLFAAR